MHITDSVAFVTGGQRGIGRAIALELLDRGATKVYVTARTPQPESDPRLVPVALDVNDAGALEAAAKSASDTTIVINNAGVPGASPLLHTDLDFTRQVFETNFFGALQVARTFAPVLAANGGGTLVHTLSALSWLAGAGAYGASKAALWNATNSLRIELREQNTNVIGVHVGFVDTGMTKNLLNVPKVTPQQVAETVADGIETGATEVIVDDISQHAKARLSGPADDLDFRK